MNIRLFHGIFDRTKELLNTTLVIQGKQNVIVYWSEIRKTCEILEGKKIYTLVQNNSLPSLFLEQHDNICINSCSDFAINYFVDKRILTKYLI